MDNLKPRFQSIMEVLYHRTIHRFKTYSLGSDAGLDVKTALSDMIEDYYEHKFYKRNLIAVKKFVQGVYPRADLDKLNLEDMVEDLIYIAHVRYANNTIPEHMFYEVTIMAIKSNYKGLLFNEENDYS